MLHNDSRKIREHYDAATPFYKELWGQHIHHGYYTTKHDSKETAAENLIKFIVERSRLSKGSRVLDVGCGVGASSIWLTEKMDCSVTGVTISPAQARMASEAAANMSDKPTFLVGDANDLSVAGAFDVIWIVEVMAHLYNRAGFFRRAAGLLPRGGKICEAAWLREDRPLTKREERCIREIEEGMLVSLPTLAEYQRHYENNSLRVLYCEDISEQVAPTWEVCLDILKNKALWQMAARHGKEFVSFLRSFKAMREGYKTGALRYAVIILEKD